MGRVDCWQANYPGELTKHSLGNWMLNETTARRWKNAILPLLNRKYAREKLIGEILRKVCGHICPSGKNAKLEIWACRSRCHRNGKCEEFFRSRIEFLMNHGEAEKVFSCNIFWINLNWRAFDSPSEFAPHCQWKLVPVGYSLMQKHTFSHFIFAMATKCFISYSN